MTGELQVFYHKSMIFTHDFTVFKTGKTFSKNEIPRRNKEIKSTLFHRTTENNIFKMLQIPK